MADTTKQQNQKESQQQETRKQEDAQLARREPSKQLTRERLFGRESFLARDPFQMMREMMRWDPFREMAPLAPGIAAWSPDFEVRETKDSYVFKADLPGLKKEDLDISLVGNRLQVSGKREEEEETKDDTYYAYERNYGSFTRTFTLPEATDTEHIRSELRDGVLTLVVPKKPEAKPRKIQIGTGEKH